MSFFKKFKKILTTKSKKKKKARSPQEIAKIMNSPGEIPNEQLPIKFAKAMRRIIEN